MKVIAIKRLLYEGVSIMPGDEFEIAAVDFPRLLRAREVMPRAERYQTQEPATTDRDPRPCRN